MAYLAFETVPTLPAFGAASADAGKQTGFTALEWRVIALARHDGLDSTRSASRIASAVRGLFGFADTNRLADPRLEALRRVTVMAWHRGDRLPDAPVAEFLAQGFSRAHLVLLLGEIARRRGADRTAPAQGFTRIALLVFAVVLATALLGNAAAGYFEDVAIGALAGLLLFIGGVAVASASRSGGATSRRMA